MDMEIEEAKLEEVRAFEQYRRAWKATFRAILEAAQNSLPKGYKMEAKISEYYGNNVQIPDLY